jgi:phosphopantothenoylcysteine decarboxylase/phosphopantothenate--cysteine ligase
MANGICDNLLIATYLSSKCPIYFVPAMDLTYKHPQQLQALMLHKLEYHIPAESGELASGLSEGRMAEPENIVSFLEADLESRLPLKGKKILITAGPTEAIDPVRFRESPPMGFDIAKSAANLELQ